MQLYVNAPDRRAVLDEKMLTALPSLEAARATTLRCSSRCLPLTMPFTSTATARSSTPLDALACARSGPSIGQDARSDEMGSLWPATLPAPWSGRC